MCSSLGRSARAEECPPLAAISPAEDSCGCQELFGRALALEMIILSFGAGNCGGLMERVRPTAGPGEANAHWRSCERGAVN